MRLMTGRDALLIDQCAQLGRGQYAVIEKKRGAADQVRPRDIASCNKTLGVVPTSRTSSTSCIAILPRR